MYCKNYKKIITKKVSEELKNLIGYKVDKVFEPNKNTIILGLYKAGKNIALLSCISSDNYRIHTTSHNFKNPMNAPSFCMLLRKHLIGFKIKNIYTHNLERIVFIDFENNENPEKPIYKKLIIELMGKHSNIILTNNNDIIIDSIRHSSTEENAQRDIYPTCRYIMPKSNHFDFSSIYNEDIISSNNLKFNIVYKDDIAKDYILTLADSKEISSNKFILNDFLDDFYYAKENLQAFKNLKNQLLNIVSSTLKKYKKRLDNINQKLLECDGMDKFKIYGELITANLYRISNKNINEVTLENYYDNNNLITIPLNEKYSPSYNAKRFFKKYSKLKNALEVVTTQKQQTLDEINYIESVLFEIENCTDYKDIETLYVINEEINENTIFKIPNKTKSKKKTHKKTLSFNPIVYTVEDYKIYVGRNNKENDYLTTKFANKNDIWFHTKDIHGAHVILKTNPNETIPDNILIETAKIAVSHSKAKYSSKVPVDYCNVAFVKKPNNSKPGFVIYKNNKTIVI